MKKERSEFTMLKTMKAVSPLPKQWYNLFFKLIEKLEISNQLQQLHSIINTFNQTTYS